VLELRLRRSDPLPGGGLVPEVPVDAQVWRDWEGVSRGYGFTHGNDHWIYLPHIAASFRFTSAGKAVDAIVADSTPRDLVEETYRRRIVPFALQALGRELLHASAVQLPHGAIAFCGGSGAGKSTLAHALSQYGHRQLADDALLFETVSSSVQVFPLPFAVRLVKDLGPNGGISGRKESREVRSEDWPPVPLRAVFLLERTSDPRGEDPAFVPLPSREAFSLLLYHAHCFSFSDNARRQQMLERYLELTARVPVYHLHSRPALDRLPAFLDAVKGVIE
jgi:hypothetical protein